MTSLRPSPIAVRDAGDAALLLELEPLIDPDVNARAIAIAQAVRERRWPGVRDVVSTFRSVAIYFDPLVVTDVEPLREAVAATSAAPAAMPASRAIEVPVVYGGEAGPDLDALATATGMSAREVVDRHRSATYRVFMLGFLPGFPYMGMVDPWIAASRHASPRLRVPAGSVGIAGRQTGIYPMESPGGWQIIGRTPLQLFDAARERPSLFAPGDRVRFVETADGRLKTGAASDADQGRVAAAAAAAVRTGFSRPTRRTITVITPGLFTTVQDEGRWGHQTLGVPVGGALDAVSHRIANAAVGNDLHCASIEVTLQGPELRFDSRSAIAIAGADFAVTLDGAPMPMATGVVCHAGSVLRFGERRAGARAYIAVDGGADVPAVLGSRSTHVLAALGGVAGRPFRAGDLVPLGASGTRLPRRAVRRRLPDGGARLRVMPGPHDDRFPAAAIDTLHRSRFTITPHSNRMGYRLTGGAPIRRTTDEEMISDATFAGAVQVPPSGDPILLMADRQVTGGYPIVAVVITADLPIVGQLAPGDWIEFQLCSPRDAVLALAVETMRATGA